MSADMNDNDILKIDRSRELQNKIRATQREVSSMWDEMARVESGIPLPYKIDPNEIPSFLLKGKDSGHTVQAQEPQVTADGLLRTAADTIAARGAKRDNGNERSMERIVKVFSALTDHKLTEEEGWLFMIVLKLCRERTGSDMDNWVDGAAYVALAAEAVARNKAPT